MTTYRKERRGAPPGFFACEAAGLRWLRVPDGPRVVEVLAVEESALELELLHPAAASPTAAEDLGRALARLHDAGADAFGCAPPGWDGDGFFGPLDDPRVLLAGRCDRWGAMYADLRIEPVRRLLRGAGRLDGDLDHGLALLADRLRDGAFDDDAPPARVHGDLWSGNVVWTDAGAVLIDPAAHGGHRLTDLAMLDLFGAPHLDRLTSAYEEHGALPDGWRSLLPLHQVHPVAMHAVLFGGGYVARTATLVERLVGRL